MSCKSDCRSGHRPRSLPDVAVDGHGSVVGIRLSGEFARVDVCRRSVMAL